MCHKARKTVKMAVLTDEKGEKYILDANGKKIYVQVNAKG